MSEDNVLRIRLSLKGRPIKSYSFNQDVITVGRDPDADVFLDNPGVSREHVRIERLANGSYCFKDLGSANGSLLNDKRVDAAAIYSSDVMRIGKYSLWLSVESDRRNEDEPTLARRASWGSGQETVMLSTAELERMMAASREPASSDAATDSFDRSPNTMPTTVPGTSAKRVQNLIGIGVVMVLAALLSAGFTWLFLR